MGMPSIATISIILENYRDLLGLQRIAHIAVDLLGRGEANLNVVVTVEYARRFNLRIGLRGEESKQTLQREYDILQLVPEGIAPRAFVVDVSCSLLPQPYSVLSYVEGAVKQEWTTPDLLHHARTLARLHAGKFAQHGAIGHLSTAPFDFLHRFDVALDYWQTHHPYLLEIALVQRLVPAIRQFVRASNELFTRLHGFSIVHGDAHPLNILFNDAQVQYIDWEWASIGDPAQDVAAVGWDIATAWQMQLMGARLAEFLAGYLALQPDDTLSARRDVWMVYTMFFDQMYHRTQIPADATGRQLQTVSQIESYLARRFL